MWMMAVVRACRVIPSQAEKRWIDFFKTPAIWWDDRQCRNQALWIEQQNMTHETASRGERRNAVQLVAALKRCSATRDLEGGKKLHQDAVAAGIHRNNYIAASLITMYSKCRSMSLAQQVFDEIMVQRDVVCWNSLIQGYVQHGKNILAMDLFARMDCDPNAVTYVAALKACRSLASERESDKRFCLEKGSAIHNQARNHGFVTNMLVASTLVDMYSKCGSMNCAREVFDNMASKDVVTWTSLILGYVQNGQSLVAMDLFTAMDCEPDTYTYVAALKACRGLASDKDASERQFCLEKGIAIHKRIEDNGFGSDILVATTLVDMYSKCGSMQRARDVFDRMVSKDVVTWNSLILGYVQNGDSLRALDTFGTMDCKPNALTYIALLKACGSLAESDKHLSLEKGIAIHEQVKAHGLVSEMVMATTLVDMYSKCGSMQRARNIFDKMTRRDAVTWNSLILGYVQNGENLVAMDLFNAMDCEPNAVTYVAALKACGGPEKQLSLEKGIAIHKKVKERGFELNILVASTLVDMYCKCGNMDRAREVFNRIISKDVVTWNSLILGYVQNGESLVAMELFTSMDCEPNTTTYVAALKACGGLANESDSKKEIVIQKGSAIHKRLKDRGFELDIAVATTLMDMYSKCGSMQLARKVFDGMVVKDIVTWNSLILGYVQNGESAVALDLFGRISCEPNCLTYIAALKACGSSTGSENESEKAFRLEKGIAVHRKIEEYGFDSNMFVANSLVGMYSNCGRMELAKKVFDRMPSKDAVTWNSLILGYVQNGQSSVALDLFTEMDCEPSSVTYVAVLKACGGLACEKESDKYLFLEKGIFIHKRVKELGLDSIVFVGNSLVDMYSKCGNLQHAREVFDSMVSKDVVTWNSLIQGYVQNGESLVALDLFAAIDCEPNSITYVAALKACGSVANDRESEKRFCLEKGMAIHERIKQHGCDSDIVVATTLVDMYSKCGSMHLSREVFDSMVSKDVISWNSLLLGYVQNGENLVAMDLFTAMDCEPNALTYVAALKACGGGGFVEKQVCLEKGMAIHKQVKERGFDSNIFVANTLVDLYSKCGSMDLARGVFDSMETKDVFTWTSMILGYVQNLESTVAVDMFACMDCEPNTFTYTAVLKACGSLAALPAGQQIHASVCKLGLEQQDPAIATTLIDLYGKCGSMSRAQELFNNMPSPDIVSWNALIAGYSFIGDSSQVFSLAKQMQEARLQFNGVTTISILTACSHAGLVDKGKCYFDSIAGTGLGLSVEHYTCMIDLLGRANRVQEALALVKSMPFQADCVAWRTLLGACRKWMNVEVGKVAFDALVAAGNTEAASYVLMSDILGQRASADQVNLHSNTLK